MTTVERTAPDTEIADHIAVGIVDTDVHPMPASADVLKSYAPTEWVDRIWPTGKAVTPTPHFYDTPDSFKTMSLRVDSFPPTGGIAGSDPDFAAKQLLVDAGVSIATLEPMCDAQLPQNEHVVKSTYNDWLADVWLDGDNGHGRWRGSIGVTASRNGLPVATHLMGQTPFELIPMYPVGNPAHWHDFFASWPLPYVSHLMSLVFDGAFDRHPDLRIVFVEGEMMDMGDNPMFSTDYPHWSHDSPSSAIKRFPKYQRDRIMRGNAMALYGLPDTVKAHPGEGSTRIQ